MWGWGQEDITKMSGPFAVQEYLQELISKFTVPPLSYVCLCEEIGSDPSNIVKICEPPSEVDESVWQYEHIRQFIIELNLLVV